MESLARLLESALPASRVQVVRRGTLLSRRKHVEELRVEFGDYRYVLRNGGDGPLTAERAHVKRGIVLRTEPVPVEEWIGEVGAALDEYARANQAAASALESFFNT